MSRHKDCLKNGFESFRQDYFCDLPFWDDMKFFFPRSLWALALLHMPQFLQQQLLFPVFLVVYKTGTIKKFLIRLLRLD